MVRAAGRAAAFGAATRETVARAAGFAAAFAADLAGAFTAGLVAAALAGAAFGAEALAGTAALAGGAFTGAAFVATAGCTGVAFTGATGVLDTVTFEAVAPEPTGFGGAGRAPGAGIAFAAFSEGFGTGRRNDDAARAGTAEREAAFVAANVAAVLGAGVPCAARRTSRFHSRVTFSWNSSSMPELSIFT